MCKMFVLIRECVIPRVRVYYICGPNKENIVSISVGIVVCRSVGIQRWLLPSRGYSLIEILVASRGVAP